MTQLVQSHFSEEKKMERLRQDIIRQSNLLKSTFPVTVNNTSLATRRMNPSTLSIRGGKLECLKNLKLLTTIIKKIQKWINWLWFILYDPLTKGKSNILLDLLRFNLLALIRVWGLTLDLTGGIVQMQLPNPLAPIAYGMVTGPIVGFFGVSTTLALEFFITALATKSVTQQINHNYRYKKYKSKIVDVIHETLTEDSELKNKIYEIMERSKKITIEEPNIEPLNWNIDSAPAIEKTAEPFGIVNDMVKESSVSEIINESNIGKIIKESNSRPSLAERVKARVDKKRYQTMQGLVDKLKKGEQLYDEYIQPIRRVAPVKVE